MSSRNILAIGTSAGGFDALRFLASQFSHDLPASVLVAIHLSSQSRSTLDAILTQSGPLIAGFAEDGERLQKSRIYIGPPERHLLLEGDTLRLGRGPRENNARPAIDPMFRSVALCCGVRAIGVVLTGTLGDGAAGLQILKQSGGITLVQDPSDAVVSVKARPCGRPCGNAGAPGSPGPTAGRIAHTGSGWHRVRGGDCQDRAQQREQFGAHRPAIRSDMP